MKFSSAFAVAFAITPVLSAAIADVAPRDALAKRLFGDAHDFPDKVKCPKTDAGDNKEFEKDQMEDTAKAWKDKLNDKKKISNSDQKQGYPARYAIGSESAPDGTDAKKFWDNTQNMKFSDECMKGFIWEVPLLANGKTWSTDGNNGDAGPYRLYFLAKDGDVKFCGSAFHSSNDPAKGSEFNRCEPDN
jgi:hypothetical protein